MKKYSITFLFSAFFFIGDLPAHEIIPKPLYDDPVYHGGTKSSYKKGKYLLTK